MFEMKISKEELQEIILEELKKEMLEEGELEEGIGRKLRSLFGMQSEKDLSYDLADLDREEQDAALEAEKARRQANLDMGVEVEENFETVRDALRDAENALRNLSQLDKRIIAHPRGIMVARQSAKLVKNIRQNVEKIMKERNPAAEPDEEEFMKGQEKARRGRASNLQRNTMTAGMVPHSMEENKKRKKRR